MSAILANIHRDYIRRQMNSILEKEVPWLHTYFIGFESTPIWTGMKHEILPLNSSLWASGKPTNDTFYQEISYGSLNTNTLKMSNVKSTYYANGAICMKHESKCI